MAKVFAFMDEDRRQFLKVKHEEAKRFIDPKTGKIFSHMMERVLCPVCHVDDTVYVFEKRGFDFVKCKHCGLLHVNPQLKSDVQDTIYKKSKTAEYWVRLQQKAVEQSWNADKKYLPALRKINELQPEKGRLLDVGCSIGQFLTLAQKDGWQCEGVELNADAANIARQDYGLSVHSKKLEEVGFPDNSFDVVTLWGVFEHLTDPVGMLQAIRKVLKKNGLVLFFVPNGHSLIIRLSREHNSTVSGRAHLWYFTPSTMKQILEKNGFEKTYEFSVLPQTHEIQHFLQYNTLYCEPEMVCEEEFTISESLTAELSDFINKNKLGYKLITIGRRLE